MSWTIRLLFLVAVLALVDECGRLKAAKKKCLHGQTLITLSNGQARKASELSVGDEVTVFSQFDGVLKSRVTELRNVDPEARRQFVEIVTVSGSRVAVTPEHGLLAKECGSKGPWTLTSAGDVSKRMCVPKVLDGQFVEEGVLEMRYFEEAGIVQPITETGTIVADGIGISCYDTFDDVGGMKSKKGTVVKFINFVYYSIFGVDSPVHL